MGFSVFKSFTFKERYNAQFRVELFNRFNHPIISYPYGAANGAQLGFDSSAAGTFGCGCATPDVAAGNPLVGSGSARVMQLGMKFTSHSDLSGLRLDRFCNEAGVAPHGKRRPFVSCILTEEAAPAKGYDELALSRLEITRCRLTLGQANSILPPKMSKPRPGGRFDS